MSFLTLIYAAALLAHLAALLLFKLSKEAAGFWLIRLGVVVLAAGFLSLSWQAWRPPLYGMWEIMLTVTLVAGLCGLFSRGAYAKRLRPWVAGANLVLLLFALTWPKTPGLDYYMYSCLWTLCFFFFRNLALGFLLYAALAFLASLFNQDQRQALAWLGRNFLLLGCAVFLAGEMSGSYWALNWMGDFWLWGRSFLISTMMFLSAMFAFHLPAGLAGRPRLAAALGALPAMLALAITIVQQFVEGV